MDPRAWDQAKELIAEALARSPSERDVFVRERCSNPSLLAEVRELLANAESLSGFLEPAKPESVAPGTRFGPYEIVSLVGAGGMGEVYRARDLRLGRVVALKVLPAAFSADPDRLRRFEQEARAAAALNHPNILAIHDVGTQADITYVVSELLEGITLRDVLVGGELPVRKALDYAIQIAQGLAAAHQKGIVHRDLKPENVFITRDDRVKILDFGLAKQTEKTTAVASTALGLTGTPTAATDAGTVLGTVGYM